MRPGRRSRPAGRLARYVASVPQNHCGVMQITFNLEARSKPTDPD